MDQPTEEKIVSLVELMIDGQSSAKTRQELTELIRDNTQARDFYIRQCQLHAMLAWEHGVLPSVEFDSKTAPQKTSMLRSFLPRMSVSLIAFVLLIGGVSFWNSHSTPSNKAPVANSSPVSPEPQVRSWENREAVGSIVKSHGAKLIWSDTNRSLDPGDMIRLGKYTLDSGFIELSFNIGVTAIIEAPASFELKSNMLMVLERGVLSARVTPTGKGFSVLTPTANVIDHGTEFAVEVFDDTGSEIHVFEGEVDVRPKMAHPTTAAVRLVTDQATRISSIGRIPQGIDIARERFIRKLTEPGSEQHGYSEMIESLKPVTYLPMASSVDGRALADSGSGNTPAFLRCDQMSSPPFAPGRVGQALRLDGPSTTSYAMIPRFPRAINNQITVCAWVKAESRPRWAAIAKHWAIEIDRTTGEPYGLGGQFHFGLNEDSGDLEVQILDTQGKRIQVREGEALPLHQWNHVAFVVDGEKVTLFRNGRAVGSQPCVGLGTKGPEALGIGTKLLDDGSAPDERNPGYWHGRIDELAIFHHALTPVQIASLFEVGQPKPTLLGKVAQSH